MPDKIHYSNEELAADLHEINRQMLHDNFRPDVIVGIARGGLVPATMLSHYHSRPLMVINYSLRDKQVSVSHITEISEINKLLRAGQNILLVDDICDSGETLAKVQAEILDNLWVGTGEVAGTLATAVLWNNTAQDQHDPNYVGREISRAEDERWVIFPYEEWWKA